MIVLNRYIKKKDLELFKDDKMEFKLLMIKSKGRESRQELHTNQDSHDIAVEVRIFCDGTWT